MNEKRWNILDSIFVEFFFFFFNQIIIFFSKLFILVSSIRLVVSCDQINESKVL